MTFNEVLLQRRKSRGLSQEELAEQLGISRQAVSKWETGEASPDLNKLIALSNVLDISLDALCGLQEEAPPVTHTPTAHTKKNHIPVWAAVLAALVLLVGSFFGGHYVGRSNAPEPVVSEAPTQLPETISVTGLGFSPETDGVTYQFTPSFISPDCTYQITFTASGEEEPVVCDTAPVGGVCTGKAVLDGWTSYSVTIVISNGETSRANSVAYNFSYSPSANGEDGVYGGGSASWNLVD